MEILHTTCFTRQTKCSPKVSRYSPICFVSKPTSIENYSLMTCFSHMELSQLMRKSGCPGSHEHFAHRRWRICFDMEILHTTCFTRQTKCSPKVSRYSPICFVSKSTAIENYSLTTCFSHMELSQLMRKSG